MKDIGYLYFPGLNTHNSDDVVAPRLHERMMQWYWHRAGMKLEYVPVSWRSPYGEVVEIASQKVRGMTERFGGVALIGASAGASLALNIFAELSDENITLVTMHGRVAEGNYPRADRRSLERAAKLDSSCPARSFYDSVRLAERAAAGLTDDERRRILVLKQLTDLVVPLEVMDIVGVETHRSISFGHTGGFVAHAFANRDNIRTFAEKALR